jgi:hypothetical protein
MRPATKSRSGVRSVLMIGLLAVFRWSKVPRRPGGRLVVILGRKHRRPLLRGEQLSQFHFLVLEVIFYGLHTWRSGSHAGETDKVILVTAAEVSRLEASWRVRWNRAPTQDEITSLVTDYVQEIALYRQAVAMGLDQNDHVVASYEVVFEDLPDEAPSQGADAEPEPEE